MVTYCIPLYADVFQCMKGMGHTRGYRHTHIQAHMQVHTYTKISHTREQTNICMHDTDRIRHMSTYIKGLGYTGHTNGLEQARGTYRQKYENIDVNTYTRVLGDIREYRYTIIHAYMYKGMTYWFHSSGWFLKPSSSNGFP